MVDVARPRKKGNQDIPLNLYRGDGGAWRYRHPTTGKFYSMGTDKVKAFRAAQKLNDTLIPVPDLVAKVLNDGEEVVLFKDFTLDYIQNWRLKGGKPVSENTMCSRRSQFNRMIEKWGHLNMQDVTLKMVNEHLESIPATSAIVSRSLLSKMYDVAVAKGICKDNPARITLKPDAIKQRKRHTIDGLLKIREAGDPWLQNAIDLALLTAQRLGDLCNLKWADIRDGYIHISQQKTTSKSDDDFQISKGAGHVRIKINAELQEVLDRCKDHIYSPFVLHRKFRLVVSEKKEHPTQFSAKYLSKLFSEATKRSNAYPKLDAKQRPTFHEIRALAIYLHKKKGLSAQNLAGHAQKGMTEYYESGHGIIYQDATIGISLKDLAAIG